MKKELKRILCAALAAAAAVGSLSGCGPKESADDGQLTWYCGVSAGGTDAMWDTATVLKKVVENTGVRPKIIIPTNGGSEKINLLTATNALPDLLTFDASSSDMDTLIQSNKVYPLDELIEKYAPDFKEQIPEVIWEQVKNRDDGKLYGLPSFFIDGTGSLSGTQGYNVRADIYEAIGSPDMTTPDGFVDALKKFKEQYPTIDGKESIPLDMNQQCWGLYILERSFGIVDNSYVDENGDVKVKWRNPKYRDLVKFMARLNREGLLDKNMYVKQSNQIDEDRALGVSFCVPASLDQLWNASAVMQRTNPNAYYKMVEPMRAVEDPVFQPVYPYSYWTITGISKDSKDPEKAVKFLQYLWSREGNFLMNYGIEGENYTLDADGDLEKTEYALEQEANNADKYMQETGIMSFRFLYYPGYFKTKEGASTEDPKRQADREIACKYAKLADVNLSRFIEPTKNDADILTIKENMDSVVNSTIYKYTLEADEDKALAALDGMLQEFDRIGVGKLEEFRTQQYKKNVEMFGDFSKN